MNEPEYPLQYIVILKIQLICKAISHNKNWEMSDCLAKKTNMKLDDQGRLIKMPIGTPASNVSIVMVVNDLISRCSRSDECALISISHAIKFLFYN